MSDSGLHIGVDGNCWANRRGYGRYMRELLRTLLAMDQHNRYSFYLDAVTAAQCDDLPGTARQVVARTRQSAVEAASATGSRSLRDLWAMRSAVAQEAAGLDLFYFPSVYTYFPVPARVPVLVTIHDTIPERFPHLTFSSPRTRLMWTLKTRYAVRQATAAGRPGAIATVSETAKRAIVAHFGVPAERVVVIPDAAGREFRPLLHDSTSAEVLQRYDITGAGRFILYVGGLSPHKNLPALLEAFVALVADGAWPDVQLVLVGDYTGDSFLSGYDALRQAAAAPALQGRVRFTGFVPDEHLVHIYNAAAALVLPSFDEGFGLPAVEAMACGTPVVVSRAGALPEVVGEAGLLFDPAAPRELRACLDEVLTNDVLRMALRERGLRRASEFSWERSTAIALDVFEALVKEGRGDIERRNDRIQAHA
jgi:glycosyltransferase involved in cell wall biosynthesis